MDQGELSTKDSTFKKECDAQAPLLLEPIGPRVFPGIQMGIVVGDDLTPSSEEGDTHRRHRVSAGLAGRNFPCPYSAPPKSSNQEDVA